MRSKHYIKVNELGCKLYHKTTWFETSHKLVSSPGDNLVANYITKLRGLKRATYNHCVA